MFVGFECCMCGCWSYDGDFQDCICLKCIDDLSEWGDPDHDK